MADVAVKAPLGGIAYVPAEQLQQAIVEGYEPATPAEETQAKLEAQYGGAGSQAAALGSGVLAGATVGLSDVAIAELGGREALAAYEQLHGGLRTGGQLIGALAPTARLGGAGALARAGRAITAPSRAVAKLGTAIGEAAGARGLGRAAQLGLGGATEGALYGAGEGLGHAAIDNDYNGEKIGLSIVGGMVGGGAIGYGLGKAGAAITNAIGRPSAAGVAGAVEGVTGGAVGGWSRRIKRTLGEWSGHLTGKDPALLGRLAEDDALRSLHLDADARIGDAIPLVQRHLDTLFDADVRLSENVRFGSLKADHVAKNIPLDRLGAQQSQFYTFAEEAKRALDEMIAAGSTEFAGTAQLKILRRQLERADANIGWKSTARKARESLGGVDAAKEIYRVMDVDLKREFQRFEGRLRRTPTRDLTTAATTERISELASKLRTGLEDQAVWGRAGVLQAEMNAPLHRALATNEAFVRDFYAAGRDVHPTDTYLKRPLADPRKIEANAYSAAKPGESLEVRAMRDTLNNKLEHYTALEKYGDLSPKSLADLATARASTKEALATFAKMTEAARAKVAMQEMAGAGSSLPAMLVGAAIGSGAPAAALIAPLLNPVKLLRAITAAETLASKVDARLGSKVGALFGNAKPVEGVVRFGTRATVLAQDRESRRREYRQKSAHVSALAERPEALRADLSKALEPFGRLPTAQAAAVSTAVRAATYLNSVRPKQPMSMGLFQQEHPVSRAESDRWLRRLRAIEDPATLLEDLENGTLNRDAIEAVQKVYPQVFADMQARLGDKARRLQDSGKAPAYEQRLQLGMLLGMPADPTMRPEMVTALQAMYAATPQAQRDGQPAPQVGGAPDLAKHFATGSEQTENKQWA